MTEPAREAHGEVASEKPHDVAATGAGEPSGDAAPAPPQPSRKLTRFDAVVVGGLVGINLLSLLVFAMRALLQRKESRQRQDEGATRESVLDAALSQYREAMAAAASRLGQLSG